MGRSLCRFRLLASMSYAEIGLVVVFVCFTIMSLNRVSFDVQQSQKLLRAEADQRNVAAREKEKQLLVEMQAELQELRENVRRAASDEERDEKGRSKSEGALKQMQRDVERLQEQIAQMVFVPRHTDTGRAHEGSEGSGDERSSPAYQFPVPESKTTPPDFRVVSVRKTLKTAWSAYTKHAMGADELEPVSNRPKHWDRTNKQMVTLVDSLDTLYVAGLRTEFREAVDYLKKHFKFDPYGNVGLFETTIRVLGGLLSAYALSKDKVVLDLAVSCANQMIPAYEGAPRGEWPGHTYNPKERRSGAGYGSFLAEGGSVQLEYKYLSEVTGNPKYNRLAAAVYDITKKHTLPMGLIQSRFSNGRFSGDVGTGSYSDSYYEYLLKVWLLTYQTEDKYKEMYIKAANGIVDHLTKEIPNTDMSYLVSGTPSQDGKGMSGTSSVFEHLSCFVPGMLALGSLYMDKETAQRHLIAAKRIVSFCVSLYRKSKTGLSPDHVSVSGSTTSTVRANYGLRPETVESLFYMWRVTRDPIYREWGWDIYKAIEKHCRTCATCNESGYSEIENVDQLPPHHTNHMDTFFTGETLKYLYLLFAADSALDLDCWVLNTEAHPFPKFPLDSSREHLKKCTRPNSPY